MQRPVTYLLYCPADSATAYAIQQGLQRFSRSFWQQDAIDVRVEPALAVNDTEPKVILVVSATSAASPQFNREVAAWVEVNGTDGVLLVVIADDQFRWGDPESVSFTYVPDSVRSGLSDEPRHLQISPGLPESELTLRDGDFRDQIAQLVASIRGVPKDEVDGEDIRQQRRRNRLAFSACGVVIALLAVAGVLVLAARNQQRAADEQEIRAQEATEEAQAQARLTAAAELAATVLANPPDLVTDPRLIEGSTDFDPEYYAQFSEDRALLSLLAVAAYQLDPSAEALAAMASRTTVWRRHEPLEVAESDPYDFPFLDDRGMAVYRTASGMLLTSGTDEPVQQVELSGLDRIITAGGHGRWLIAARDVSDDGPQNCVSALAAECQEVLLVDLQQEGVSTTLRTELGVRSVRSSPGDPQWPNPVRQHRFTTDGAFLLSHDAVADQLVVTNTDSGVSQTIWVDGDDQLADFGVIDDQTGWRLHGATLETWSLADGRMLDSYNLDRFGEPLSADFFPGGDRALVGFAPANYQIIDLASMTEVVSATIGDLAEEIDIGPNGQWITTSGADFLYLLDGETLTEITRTSVLGVRNDQGIDEAEVSFDPSGERVMMRLMNPSGYSVSVAELDPRRWQQELCSASGRSLSAAEWDEHVGLADREEVCPQGSDAALGVPDSVPAENPDEALGDDSFGLGSGDEDSDTEPPDEGTDEAAPSEDTNSEEEAADGESIDSDPDREPVVLVGGADGLGGVSFGESEVVTVRALVEQLGEPSDKFVCNDLAGCGPHDPLGVFVSWGGLSVHIADTTNMFSYYSVSERSGEAAPTVETERGIRLGTSVGELLAAYPDLEQFSGCADYDAVYEPASGVLGEGEFIDRQSRHSFSVSDDAVAAIRGSAEASFWFWSALSCLP